MVSSFNRISGMASGMDTEAMVKNMMAARRKPLDKLIAQKQLTEWQREDYRTMNAKIYEFRNTKLFNFKQEGNLMSRVATSGNTNVATVRTKGDALLGTINLKVNKVATAATNISGANINSNASFDPDKTLASQAANLSGALTPKVPATTPPTYENYEIKINDSKAIIVNPNVDSLNAVIDRINKNSNVTAYYAEGKVSFTSKQTGTVNGVNKDQANISFTGNFFTDILKITGPGTAAENASVDINGIPAIAQKSNTFTVNGVEITLNPQAAAGSTTSITVKTDADKMVEGIKGFINDYNDLLKTLQEKVKEKRNRDFAPLTDEQKKEMKEKDIDLWTSKARSGLLKNDSIISSAITDMRMAIMAQVETGSDKYKTLSSIGIETGQYIENGKLYLKDEQKLRKAIAENPDAVIAMFRGTGVPENKGKDVGIGERIYAKLQNTLNDIRDKAGTSPTARDNSTLGKRMDDFDKSINNWKDRLVDIENRYNRQFTAMEKAINKYNSQSGYLAKAFGGK